MIGQRFLQVLFFIIMRTVKLVIVTVGLLLLLVLVILPGIFSVNVVTHELYHVFRHQDAAKSICVDINSKPFVAHTVVTFPNASALRTYVETEEENEEGIAGSIGQVASLVYVLFCLAAVFLIGWIVADSVKPRIVVRFRKLRKRLGEKKK